MVESDRLSRELAQKLVETRMSAEALAAKAGLGRDTVGRWIRGETVPTLGALRKVEQVLSRQLGRPVDFAEAVSERRAFRAGTRSVSLGQSAGPRAAPAGTPGQASSDQMLRDAGTGSKGSRSAYWATVLEIRRRTGRLIGRGDELAGITSFAHGNESYRWLVGDAWSGKTALLAEAVSALPPDVDVVCIFLSRREASADSLRFLFTVVPQLAILLGTDSPAPGLDEFRTLWQRAAERAGALKRSLLLVVDGLDEDVRPPGLPSVAAVLPAGTGSFVHVLVSSRSHPELPVDVPVGHPLRLTKPALLHPFPGARNLALLAQQEVDDLLRRDDDGLAADVLGLLVAAGGALAAADLAAMSSAARQSPVLAWRVRRLLDATAARSIQSARAGGTSRYQFAHESLLVYAQSDEDLSDPDFRRRIHEWAEKWRTAGWPAAVGTEHGTPRYLLDSYPATLSDDPQRLTQLVSDIGWAGTAIASTDVDSVLAHLARAAAANPGNAAIASVHAVVTGQASTLRPDRPLGQPGYVMRQLWMQAAELADDPLAGVAVRQLVSLPAALLAPRWTTRTVSPNLAGELGRHDGRVLAMTVLRDGHLVTAGADGTVLLWDPDHLGTTPVELGSTYHRARAVAELADGRIVAGGDTAQILTWDRGQPGTLAAEPGMHQGWVLAAAPMPDGRVIAGDANRKLLMWTCTPNGTTATELGEHQKAVFTVVVLPDGRVVSGGADGRLLMWDPGRPGSAGDVLGEHQGAVYAVVVLPDRRVVSGGDNGELLIWDPRRPVAGAAELGRHYGPVRAVAALPDGRIIAGGDDHRVLVWKPPQHKTLATGRGVRDEWIEAMAVLPDGRVVTGGRDGRVLIWDPGRLRRRPVELGRHRDWVWTIAVRPDGTVISGGRDNQIFRWDPDRPGSTAFKLCSYRAPVLKVALLPDERLVVLSDGTGAAIWDPADPEGDLVELDCRYDIPETLAVLPDGRIIVGVRVGTLLTFDPRKPEVGPTLFGQHNYVGPTVFGQHDSWVHTISVLRNRRIVTAGRDNRILIWDLDAPGTPLAELGCPAITLAAASLEPAGSALAVAHEGGGISLWSFTG